MPKPKVISARYRSESRIAGIDSSFFSSRRRHTRYWSDWSSDVCSSDLEGRADHPHPLRAEHRVEWPAELRVPVPDEEPDRAGPSVEAQRQVARLLGHPGRVRVRRRGAHMDPPAAKLDEHQDVERPEPGGLDGEEVAGHDPARLRPEELGQVGPVRLGAG